MQFLYHNQNIRVEIPQFSSVSGLLSHWLVKFFKIFERWRTEKVGNYFILLIKSSKLNK